MIYLSVYEKKTHKLSTQEIDRIIEMAWEDRTPFEAIEKQFGLNQDDVIKIMRKSIKRKSLKTEEKNQWQKNQTSIYPILKCLDSNQLIKRLVLVMFF